MIRGLQDGLHGGLRWGLDGEPTELLVSGGRVVARGPRVAAENAPRHDHAGAFLLPALVDPHCHILPAGLFLTRPSLAECGTVEAALARVAEAHREQPDGWLHVSDYDQNRWDDRHVDRRELDAISEGRPILLRHNNGHSGIANSAALRAANVSETESDPPGGAFGRDAEGRLSGLLLERAFLRVVAAAPVPSVEAQAEAILAAGRSMADYGIGTASDMTTRRRELPAYVRAAELGCPVRLRLYAPWSAAFDGPADPLFESLRAAPRDGTAPVLAGLKLYADGAISSETAAIYGAYEGAEPTGLASDGRPVSGQLIYPPHELRERVVRAARAGWSVAIHAIGDHAVDVVLDAFEAAGDPERHRLEHAMLLSDAQIERIAALGVPVVMQPEFLAHFGAAYRRRLGPERAAALNRYRSLRAAGARLAFSSDRPIVQGDPWLGARSAARRPDGFDPAESLEPRDALAAYLDAAADVEGDRGRLGRLAPGECADALVLSDDPLMRVESARTSP